MTPHTPSCSDDAMIAESADSIGRISVDDELQNYVGGAHWAAILENVCLALEEFETGS